MNKKNKEMSAAIDDLMGDGTAPKQHRKDTEAGQEQHRKDTETAPLKRYSIHLSDIDYRKLTIAFKAKGLSFGAGVRTVLKDYLNEI